MGKKRKRSRKHTGLETHGQRDVKFTMGYKPFARKKGGKWFWIFSGGGYTKVAFTKAEVKRAEKRAKRLYKS